MKYLESVFYTSFEYDLWSSFRDFLLYSDNQWSDIDLEIINAVEENEDEDRLRG